MVNDYLVLNFEDIWKLTLKLSKAIHKKYQLDILIGLSRGGLVIVRLLSDFLEKNDLMIIGLKYYTDINSRIKTPIITQNLVDKLDGKKILIVDDVADTGKSLEYVMNLLKTKNVKDLKIATLHYKPHSILKPDFFIEETTKWIVYPWEYVEFTKLYSSQKLKDGFKKSAIKGELSKLKIPREIFDDFL